MLVAQPGKKPRSGKGRSSHAYNGIFLKSKQTRSTRGVDLTLATSMPCSPLSDVVCTRCGREKFAQEVCRRFQLLMLQSKSRLQRKQRRKRSSNVLFLLRSRGLQPGERLPALTKPLICTHAAFGRGAVCAAGTISTRRRHFMALSNWCSSEKSSK